MIFLTILLLTLGINSGNLEDIKDLQPIQLYELFKDTQATNIGDVKNEDVKYFLFTRLSTSQIIINDNTKDVIDLSKPTKFIIHGYIATSRRSWNKKMTDKFLQNGDYNVILVDWEKPARASYISAAINTKLIGQIISQFIIDARIDVNKIHFIGHSLGAHIAGFAAKGLNEITGKKVARISGLDPAAPFFKEFISIEEAKKMRLHKEDAKVVDVIHTDGGAYGLEVPIGSLDIYVNGGRGLQPGCLGSFRATSLGEFVEHSYCSHEMSITYFIEWIGGGKFRCNLCNSWKDVLIANCAETVNVGQDIDENVTGICFAKTHKRAPFLYT